MLRWYNNSSWTEYELLKYKKKMSQFYKVIFLAPHAIGHFFITRVCPLLEHIWYDKSLYIVYKLHAKHSWTLKQEFDIQFHDKQNLIIILYDLTLKFAFINHFPSSQATTRLSRSAKETHVNSIISIDLCVINGIWPIHMSYIFCHKSFAYFTASITEPKIKRRDAEF